MNNEKVLKKKIERYLLMPLALTLLLVGMVIVLYAYDRKSGVIAAGAVVIFVVCEVVFFIVMKAAIMPVVFRFALEQGQIQKELLKELDIPYAMRSLLRKSELVPQNVSAKILRISFRQ